MANIYIEKREECTYPRNNYVFNPSVAYPEYQLGEISLEKNSVYDMVRSALYGFGLDTDHYGQKEWNPLGFYINKGDRVLVKPNMVKHYESVEQNECTLTHPSVVRAIIDYCVIAGAGKIILGDAPIQGAEMDTILRNNHYLEMLEFYRSRGVDIRFVDFRNYIVKKKYGITHEIATTQNKAGVIRVSLGKESYHYKNNDEQIYEICGYDSKNINQNHHENIHDYLITEEVLKADVIINIPKPKTHRFAGITAAQKNFVGIIADKESVPHFVQGSKLKGGDETNEDSWYSKILHKSYKRYLRKNAEKKYITAYLYYFIYRFTLLTKKDLLYIHGQWHGNDTIWKSILDLERIILYANEKGQLNDKKPCRRILTIGDMILVGEGDGPLKPTSKKYGIVMISDNMPAFDWAICSFFGFDHALLPMITNGIKDIRLNHDDLSDILIKSNNEWDGVSLDLFHPGSSYFVEPHPFWKEILR